MVIGAVFFLTASRGLLTRGFFYDKEIVLKLLQFGKFVFGTNLLSSIYKSMDHFVTAYAINDPKLGKIYVSYYNMVARISGILDVPFTAVADVLFPKNAQAMSVEGPEKVKYYFERMVGILTALIIPVSLIIFFIPGLVIKVIAGPTFLPAIPLLQITMFFAFLRPFLTQFGFTMDSIGKPQVNFMVNVAIFIISLASTYLCIRKFGGFIGPVYANIFTLFSVCTMFYLILRKALGISLRNIIKYMFATYVEVFGLLKKFTPVKTV
jgi:O-antigen/teichoic acid export membrane protein